MRELSFKQIEQEKNKRKIEVGAPALLGGTAGEDTPSVPGPGGLNQVQT